VKDSPTSPISWICGYSATPEGMMAVGDNLTNVDKKFLPLGCR
jgi:type IV pilus assembly protein PilA